MSPTGFEEALALQDRTERLLAAGRRHHAELCCRQAISLATESWRARSRYPEAEALLNEALTVAETGPGDFDDETCVASNNLAVLYKSSGAASHGGKPAFSAGFISASDDHPRHRFPPVQMEP